MGFGDISRLAEVITWKKKGLAELRAAIAGDDQNNDFDKLGRDFAGNLRLKAEFAGALQMNLKNYTPRLQTMEMCSKIASRTKWQKTCLSPWEKRILKIEHASRLHVRASNAKIQ